MAGYADSRTLIKTGDILIWEGTSILSWVISKWTHSPYTHVGIAWVVGNRVLVLQADPGVGIDAAPLSKALPVFWLPIPCALTEEALGQALDRLQESYSFMNAIRAGFGLRPRYKGFQCAQYVNKVLRATGLRLHLPDLTPKSLVEVASVTFDQTPLKLT